MVDVLTPEQRRHNMIRIKGKDTKPELLLRRGLHARGLRYRLHDRALPGRPDLVLPKYKTAVFVHGCFWHRHPDCAGARMPQTRADFWSAKFARNMARDKRVESALVDAGWTVFTIWECETRDAELLDQLAWRVLSCGPRRPSRVPIKHQYSPPSAHSPQ